MRVDRLWISWQHTTSCEIRGFIKELMLCFYTRNGIPLNSYIILWMLESIHFLHFYYKNQKNAYLTQSGPIFLKYWISHSFFIHLPCWLEIYDNQCLLSAHCFNWPCDREISEGLAQIILRSMVVLIWLEEHHLLI